MFSRAAFASPSRAVARSAAVARVDLDLTGPGRGCPVEFEDDPAPMEPSVDPALLAQHVLAPAVGPLSSEQERFRHEVFPVAQSAFVASAAPVASTTLRCIASKVTAKLGARVFSINARNEFYLFLGRPRCWGPRPPRRLHPCPPRG